MSMHMYCPSCKEYVGGNDACMCGRRHVEPEPQGEEIELRFMLNLVERLDDGEDGKFLLDADTLRSMMEHLRRNG